MGLPIQTNATGVSVLLFIRDSTTGLGKTGLTYTTSGLIIAHRKKGASGATAITKATTTPSAAWTTGGFCEIDATNAKGLYKLDVPDAAFTSAAGFVSLTWTGTGVLDDGDVYPITAFDPLAAGALDTAQAELSALPALDGATLTEQIRFLYQRLRFPSATTATSFVLYKADGSTVLGTATLADDGTTFTLTEAA